ncbi:MAG: histidine kinase [Flavobacteriales bacterium]|nr:histidine kinase [Flavobacteriales bacterium]
MNDPLGAPNGLATLSHRERGRSTKKMSYFQRVPIRYRTILITAGVLATLFLFQAYMHHYVYSDLKNMAEFNWWREAPVPYLNFLFWALLCPLVYSILIRWPFQERPFLRTILIHIGFSLLIASLHEIVTSSIYYGILQGIGDFDFTDPANRSWAYSALAPAIFSRTMEYWVLMGVMVALENVRQQRAEHEQLLKLKNELQITQLNALKKQLQPHFLFNTLNTVSALMDENVRDARTVLSRLGQLLRVTLDKTQRDKVTLEREIDYIANYLGIETMRFRDRLQVDFDIPTDLRELQVPSMLLQPLVENAIKHGPDLTNDSVNIQVKASKEGERLWLEVLDNGKGCSDVVHAMKNGGIGLRNVRDRVQLLYGDRASFAIGSPEARGFHVRISLPIERNEEPANA